jgi:hypothetical protein
MARRREQATFSRSPTSACGSSFAARPLLLVLTPLLRPLFRWNHNWAIARAIEGLEPYARGGNEPLSVPVS